MRDVDQVIALMRGVCPAVKVEQLKVQHPGDDDGIWFFEQPNSEYEVQVESPAGMCPFLIETDESDARFTAKSIDETVQILTRLLHVSALSTPE